MVKKSSTNKITKEQTHEITPGEWARKNISTATLDKESLRRRAQLIKEADDSFNENKRIAENTNRLAAKHLKSNQYGGK